MNKIKKEIDEEFPQIFEIIILQSLNKTEKQTGKILYSEIIKYKTYQEEVISRSLIDVSNKKEFFSEIKKIEERIIKEKLFPILHIEAHGSEEGISLSNKDLINWSDFFNKTRKINILLKNSLIIHLALCKGISSITGIDPFERAPFRAIIGTTKDLNPNKLLNAYELYYDNFFFSFSGDEAVNSVNANIKDANFVYLRAEDFIKEFTNTNRDPVFFKRLINNYAVKEKATKEEFKNTDFKEAFNYSKEIIDKIFSDIKDKSDYFLMKDMIKTKHNNK